MRHQPLNHANYRYLAEEKRGEINNLPSQTIPDQAMSIAQILDRFVKKQPIEALQGIYTEDDLIPADLERMDPIERTMHARNLKKAIADGQQKLYDDRIEAQKKAAEKAAAAKLAPHPRAKPDEGHPDPEM